jgi:hypothetical protein
MEESVAPIRALQEGNPELRLWKAVIVHTILEWVSGPLRRQKEAEQFLFSDDRDFRLVCESAGMDAESLRMRLGRLRLRRNHS